MAMDAAAKETMRQVRAEMTAIRRSHTHRGEIRARDCMEITEEYTGLLDRASEALAQGDPVLAFSIASLIHTHLARLALIADDSYGGVTQGRLTVYPMVEEIVAAVEPDSPAAGRIVAKAIADCRDKVFDGWEDPIHDLLVAIAPLVRAKTIGKLYAFLDELKLKFQQAGYSYYLATDCLVRIEAVRAVEGAEAARALIDAHLDYPEVRQLAVIEACEARNWPRAKTLIQDYLALTKGDYRSDKNWWEQLYEVLGDSGDGIGQRELARRLLLEEHDPWYYPKLRDSLIQTDDWDNQLDDLLDELSLSLPVSAYLEILAQEEETDRLLDKIREFPKYIFEYARDLVRDYPEETWEIYAQAILDQAAVANKRSHYRAVCARLSELVRLGGSDEAMEVFRILWDHHKGQPAFMEELERFVANLEGRNRRR